MTATPHLALALTLFVLAGCVGREELGRVPSPDGIVEVVLVEANGGATTAFVYNVCVVRKGGRWQTGDEHLIATHVDDFRIGWREPRRLEICFDHARIFGFVNRWTDWTDVQLTNYVVDIRLVEPAAGCAPNARKFLAR